MRSATHPAQSLSWRRLAIMLTALATMFALSLPKAHAAVGGDVIISSASGSTTTESGSQVTFGVALSAAPETDETVTVTVSTSDTTESSVSPSTLEFTSADWTTPKAVTVIGLDDSLDDGDVVYTVSATMTSADGSSSGTTSSYNPDSIELTNVDDDDAGFTVTESDDSTATGETATTDTFEVVLVAEPISDVVLTVTSGSTDEGTVDKASLTFTSADWNDPQTVTVTGVDDDLVDGSQAYTINISIDDANSDDTFDALADQTVNATNADDDSAGFSVTESEGSTLTHESGSTDTFDVVLTKGPISDVVLTVSSGDPGEGTLSTDTLTFTTANWATPQTVTVTGVDDGSDDGTQIYVITVAVDDAASDEAFDPLPDHTVDAANTDNDVPAPEPAFDDLDGLSDETISAIETLVDMGITTGTGDGTFSPELLTQRWQMALFLTRLLEATGTTLPEPVTPFDDLTGYSAEAQLAMNQLAELGISTGTSTTEFSPSEEVTRWQMALFIVRTLDVAGVALPDAGVTVFDDLEGYPTEIPEAIATLVAMEITTGTSTTEYSPEVELPRWQMALFLTRTIDAITN